MIHICGTDEHGVPITLAAEKAKVSPQEIVDRYYESIKNSFQDFGIEFDNFSRTSRPLHHRVAQEFFLKIYKKDFIYPKTITQFYCPNCSLFLADRYVEGICPNCKKPGARGDQCENCGRWLEPFMLIEPKCKTCAGKPLERTTTHWFFALSRFQKQLEDWLLTKKNWKDNVKKFCAGWLNQGLEDRAITRDLPWGVKVPLKEAGEKVMYVWFDAPIGYISSTIEWAENKGKDWKDYWCSKDTKIVHFIGKDNIVFHAIVWPAMLLAHQEYILPSEIPANEFLNLEGRKLSTSENWAVWLPEYLKEFEPDPLRYALAVNFPENRDIDFTWNDFYSRNNNELADVLGNFVNRVALFLQNNYKNRIPQTSDFNSEDQAILKVLSEAPQAIGELIENFHLKDGLREIMNLPALGNRYFDYQAPWRTIKEDRKRCDQTLNVCVRLIQALSVLLKPYLPGTAKKICDLLGLDENLSWEESISHGLSKELKKVEILFPKLDYTVIQNQINKLGKGGKMEITIDDFKKLEIKTAKVISAERVPGTDRLLKILIDLGTERREIVAGLGHIYSPESLVGKNIVVLVNLAPAKIRGIESHGMLLAATSGKEISLLTVDKDLRPGSPVS